MKPTLTLDMTEFNAAKKEYLSLTHSKTLPEILNTKAFYIALKALEFTKRAERAAIEKLGLRSDFISPKTGRTIKRRQFHLQETVAIRNLAAALKREGITLKQKFQSAEELKEYAKKWITSKLRAIGFIASGWLPAIRRLLPLADAARGRVASDVKQFGKPKGRAIPAVAGWNPTVTIENSAGYTKLASGARGELPDIAKQRMVEALQRAFDSEVLSMRKYMADRLQKDADKFNAKR